MIDVDIFVWIYTLSPTQHYFKYFQWRLDLFKELAELKIDNE